MRITERLASGLFFLGFGGIAYWLSSELAMGTAADMGPGYTPRLLAIGCLMAGVSLTAGALTSRSTSPRVTVAPGPLVLVSVMVAGFAALLPVLGLPLAVIACVLPAAVSGEDFTWPRLLAIAVVLAALTTVLFAWGLRLQIPIWPSLPGH